MSEILAETKAIAGSIGLKLEMTPGPREIDAMLRQIPKAMLDMSPAWRRISDAVLVPALEKAFSSQSSPDGDSWAALSEAYARRKAGGSIGRSSGKLQQSLTAGGSGSIRSFGKKSARVGSRLDYAAAFQWGYGAKSHSAANARAERSRPSSSKGLRSAVPARMFIAWNDQMTEAATEILLTHLEDLVDKALVEGVAIPAGGA